MKFTNDINYLDQHFLKEQKIVDKFINICDLSKNDIVLEIGPGDGMLTKLIAPKVKKMYVIEKDQRLIANLKKIKNVEVIYGDATKIEYPNITKIITSLPYSIIEPFIYKLRNIEFKELYMIMGKKYIDSVMNYNIDNLSLLTNVFFECVQYFNIPKEAFVPMPRVESSIIKLSPKIEYTPLELLLKNVYLLDNKKTKNALMESFIIVNNITKKEAKCIVNNLNIHENILNKEFRLLDNTEIKIIYNKLKEHMN